MKIFLLVFLSLSCINAFAEVNKWVDENGRVHYSDQPPPSNAKKILNSTPEAKSSAETGNAAESGDSGEPKTIAEREADLKKKLKADKEAAVKATKEQASKDATQDNCSQAELSLKELQSGMRIMELDAKGERVYLDDEQRQQRITKTQQDISRLCN